MSGLVTKKHFFLVAKSFGLKKAFKLLLSQQPIALLVLMVD